MFLFTTPPASARETGPATGSVPGVRGAGPGVVEAIREGAENTGVGFDYLLATAQRESALDPTAKAGTSSATGLFQFIEQTWLGVMKKAGPGLGLSTFADAITTRPDGSHVVSDPAARQTILDLRRDPRIAATLAGALTQTNREALTGALGREPTGGDLYAAHVLGAKGAASLIGTAQFSPARPAALDMPEAAAANRSLFYDKSGRPRGAAELYALLATSQSGARPPVAAASSLPEVATAYAVLDGDGLRSLFQTDKRQGAVSEGVARLWQGRAAETGSAGTVRSAPTYFPRSDESAETEIAAAAASVQAPDAEPIAAPAFPLVSVPLPPRRPAAFNAATAEAARSAAGTRAAGPIEPSRFMLRTSP